MSRAIISHSLKTLLALALLLALFGTVTPTAAEAGDAPGAVYAMTNDATANQVVVLNRAADGTLTPAGAFPTGGMGSGTFENSANGLILGEQSPNNLNGSYKYLYTTNAGSDSISVFRTTRDGLELVDVEPSGGDHPLSVTVRKNLLYVLNGGASNCSGGTPSISGFTVGPQGELTPIPGSTRPRKVSIIRPSSRRLSQRRVSSTMPRRAGHAVARRAR